MAASEAFPRPDSSTAAPFEISDTFEIVVKRKQRIAVPGYFLGYKEKSTSVFHQEMRTLDLPALVRFLNPSR